MICTKEGAQKWNSMTPEEKKPWGEAHLKDRERYEYEMEQYKR